MSRILVWGAQRGFLELVYVLQRALKCSVQAQLFRQRAKVRRVWSPFIFTKCLTPSKRRTDGRTDGVRH